MDLAAAGVLCQGLSRGIVDEERPKSPSIALSVSAFFDRDPVDTRQNAEYMPIMR